MKRLPILLVFVALLGCDECEHEIRKLVSNRGDRKMPSSTTGTTSGPAEKEPNDDPTSATTLVLGKELRDITGAIAVLAPSSLGLSATAGKKLFDEKCASCHGADAAGTTSGPPLAHFVYEPSHHGDASFYNAVQNGVKGHHWRYGDMKPVADVTVPQIADIVAYVRSVQKVNGID